jgi:hypothetical protein
VVDGREVKQDTRDGWVVVNESDHGLTVKTKLILVVNGSEVAVGHLHFSTRDEVALSRLQDVIEHVDGVIEARGSNLGLVSVNEVHAKKLTRAVRLIPTTNVTLGSDTDLDGPAILVRIEGANGEDSFWELRLVDITH